jgi:hypothetical protein
MISSSRGLVAPLLLLASLLLAQCGDLEKSLNNERDLYGAIALEKTQASTTSAGTTTPAAGTGTTGTSGGTAGSSTAGAGSTAKVYFSPNHASTDVKKRCNSLAADPTKPDRCDSASMAATAARAQCASPTCEVVFEFKGTTESLVCASIASYNADTSYFGAARNASAAAADQDALQACELRLAPDRESLWCKKEGISFADCASRVRLKRLSAGAVDPIPAEVKCVVAGSACLR